MESIKSIIMEMHARTSVTGELDSTKNMNQDERKAYFTKVTQDVVAAFEDRDPRVVEMAKSALAEAKLPMLSRALV